MSIRLALNAVAKSLYFTCTLKRLHAQQIIYTYFSNFSFNLGSFRGAWKRLSSNVYCARHKHFKCIKFVFRRDSSLFLRSNVLRSWGLKVEMSICWLITYKQIKETRNQQRSVSQKEKKLAYQNWIIWLTQNRIILLFTKCSRFIFIYLPYLFLVHVLLTCSSCFFK